MVSDVGSAASAGAPRLRWGRAAGAALLLTLASGCATARLVGDPPLATADPGVARTVVLEPFFESAEWRSRLTTEYVQVSPNPLMGYGYGYGGYSGMPSTVALNRQIVEKPLFARVEVLADLHRRLLGELQKLRPSWRVTSTAGLPLITGPVTVVRTVIGGNDLTSSDRTLKNLAFGFGFVIWPLEILAGFPVQETQRAIGALERYEADAEALRSRLVRYPTQPDSAVNLSGFTPLRHEFGLDVAYEEGLLANEFPRTGVLIEGLVQRLAVAMVAIVEEPPGAAPAPAPPPPAAPPP